MSAALQLLDNAADVLAAGHDDALVLQPLNVACTGYAEEALEDPAGAGLRRKGPMQLHVAEQPFTHVLHIRRAQLSGVDLRKVDFAVHVDSGRRYRVLHWTDDPSSPTTDMVCKLA